MSVTWAEPPDLSGPAHPQAIYVDKLRLLQKRPGEWGIIKSGTEGACHGAAQQLRLRTYHVPPGEWEFSVRTYRRGVHVGPLSMAQLYARYLGPNDVRPVGSMSYDAEVDENGQRICGVCSKPLAAPKWPGKWKRRCTPCEIFCVDCKCRIEHKQGGKWPLRCPDCHSARKAEKEASHHSGDMPGSQAPMGAEK